VFGGTYPAWNDENGGNWILTEMTNLYYSAVWIFATNDANMPVIGILGQREDSNLSNAQDNNTYESLSFPDFISTEFKIIARIIIRARSTYTNSVKAALKEIVDYRFYGNVAGGGTITTSHASLTGLSYAASGHTGFLEDADLAVGTRINSASAKTTPVDADEMALADSAASASYILKKVTWANVKATLKAYFDTLYGKTPYTDTFNNTTDWGSASGGLYTITFTHSKNTSTLIVQVWDTDTGELVFPETIIIVDADNVSISVSETPDNRFNGRIVISY
jgi:hypothetical protein